MVTAQELEDMPRRELQALCKDAGIKANQKTADLIEQLKEWLQTQNAGGERKVQESEQMADDVAAPVEETSAPSTSSSENEVVEETEAPVSENAAEETAAVVVEEEKMEEQQEEDSSSYNRLEATKNGRKEASKKKGQDLRAAAAAKRKGAMSITEKFQRIHQRAFSKMKGIDGAATTEVAAAEESAPVAAAAAAAPAPEPFVIVVTEPIAEEEKQEEETVAAVEEEKEEVQQVEKSIVSSSSSSVTPWMLLAAKNSGVDVSRTPAKTPAKTPARGLNSLTRPTMSSARKIVSMRPLDLSAETTVNTTTTAATITASATKARRTSHAATVKDESSIVVDAVAAPATVEKSNSKDTAAKKSGFQFNVGAKKANINFANTADTSKIQFNAPAVAEKTSADETVTSRKRKETESTTTSAETKYKRYTGKLPSFKVDTRSIFLQQSSTEKPTPQSRPKFDLSESLKRKLPYKPHSGLLPKASPATSVGACLSVEKENSVASFSGRRKTTIAPPPAPSAIAAAKRTHQAILSAAPVVQEEEENKENAVENVQQQSIDVSHIPVPKRRSLRKSVAPTAVTGVRAGLDHRKSAANVASKIKQQTAIASNRRPAPVDEVPQLPADLPVKYT